MAVPSATAVLVVGMHRSGTSALAGVLGKLGVPLGDHLLAAGNDNPRGYWEHQDVVLVHERLLQRLGSRWDDLRALPRHWLESDAAREAAVAIGDIVDRDFSAAPLWAIKDPRLCRVLPLWRDVLQQRHIRPVVLFMVRQPGEVSASIAARNHWQPLVGTLLWLRYMVEAVAASAMLAREVVLYDTLLADPISAVATALARFGVDVGADVSEQQRGSIARFVDLAERHHTSLGAQDVSSGIAAIAGQFYEVLVSIAQGRAGWDAADRIVSAFHRQWERDGAGIDAVADMAAQIEQDWQWTKAENYRLDSALTAQIRWSEDAQARYEALTQRADNLQQQVREVSALLEQSVAERAALAAELRNVRESASWRAMRALRSAFRLFKSRAGRVIGSMRKPR